MNNFRIYLTFALTISCLTLTQHAISQDQRVYIVQDYVEVKVKDAQIYTTPDRSSEVVAQAQKGDIFRSYGTEGEWYEIQIVELPLRYLHKSLAKSTNKPRQDVAKEIRKNICVELDAVKRQANDEAVQQGRVKFELLNSVANMRLYVDRYSLPIFRKYGISSALNDELDCYNLLYRTKNLISSAIMAMTWMSPFIVIGVVIGAIVLMIKHTRSKVTTSTLKWQVLWRTFILGTLMAIPVFVIGVAVIEGSAFVLLYAGEGWILLGIMGILGLSVVGSYILGLHLARKMVNRQQRTECEKSQKVERK